MMSTKYNDPSSLLTADLSNPFMSWPDAFTPAHMQHPDDRHDTIPSDQIMMLTIHVQCFTCSAMQLNRSCELRYGVFIRTTWIGSALHPFQLVDHQGG